MIDTRKNKTKFFWCAIFLAMQYTPSRAIPLEENEVKAAFVHNIAKFVQWPSSVNTSGILRLCIVGEGPFGKAANLLQGKFVGKAMWVVTPLASNAEIRECQVLFIDVSEAGHLPRILDSIKDRQILTLGDTAGFAEQGVVINFYLEQNKVRFEINLKAASQNNIKISSQVLKLARIVQIAGPAQ